jgi:hypothetical protein
VFNFAELEFVDRDVIVVECPAVVFVVVFDIELVPPAWLVREAPIIRCFYFAFGL